MYYGLSTENLPMRGQCPFYLCLLARNSNLKKGPILRDLGNFEQRILMSVKTLLTEHNIYIFLEASLDEKRPWKKSTF